MSPGRLKLCGAASDCPATGVPHTQPGRGGVAVTSAAMAGMDGARRMLPATHALAVPIAGSDGADRKVRPEPPLTAALLGRALLLARLLAQARVAAEKDPPAGIASTLRGDRTSDGATSVASKPGRPGMGQAVCRM